MNTFFYSGPQFWLKASFAEEQLQEQQSQFYSTLTQLFQSQYSTQQATLGFLQNSLEPLIKNPQGFSPEDMTALRTSASDTISTQFQNASKEMQNRDFVLGGRQTPNGVMAAQQEGLNAAQAGAESSAQNKITQADQQLKLTNYWNAISALSGVGGMQNPSYLLSGANQAGQNAFQSAYTISNQNSLMGLFGGIASGVLGGLSGLGGAMGGKMGGFLGGL